MRRALLSDDDAEPSSGFLHALEDLAEQFSAVGLRVELITAELMREPSLEVRGALARVAEVVLSRAASNGENTRVVIRAASEAADVVLTLRDDVVAPESGEAFGDLEALVTHVGGHLEVRHAVHRGTRVGVRAPL